MASSAPQSDQHTEGKHKGQESSKYVKGDRQGQESSKYSEGDRQGQENSKYTESEHQSQESGKYTKGDRQSQESDKRTEGECQSPKRRRLLNKDDTDKDNKHEKDTNKGKDGKGSDGKDGKDGEHKDDNYELVRVYRRALRGIVEELHGPSKDDIDHVTNCVRAMVTTCQKCDSKLDTTPIWMRDSPVESDNEFWETYQNNRFEGSRNDPTSE